MGIKHRVICGAAATIEAILAQRGWKSTTSFVERRNRALRQHGAAPGRRGKT